MMTRLWRLKSNVRQIARLSGFLLVLLSAIFAAAGHSHAALDLDHGAPAQSKLEPLTTNQARMPIMPNQVNRHTLKQAASIFVWGLSNRQAEAVWYFAPKAERERFGKSAMALRFFVQVHPPLANAKSLRFDAVVEHDGRPAAQIYVKDRLGVQWLAVLGFISDDKGHWKIVSCHLVAAPGQLT